MSDLETLLWLIENHSGKRIALVARRSDLKKWAEKVDVLVVPVELQFEAHKLLCDTDIKYVTLQSLVCVREEAF